MSVINETIGEVFVYGSLMRGFGNHPVIADAELIDGAARTLDRFTMLDLGAFPGIVESDQGQSIRGELYDVSAAMLARLDRLEGHPRFYRRRMIELVDGSLVWTYVLPEAYLEGYPQVGSGDWGLRHNSVEEV